MKRRGSRGIRNLAVAAGLMLGAVWAGQINPPLGPYVNLQPADFAQSTSFSATDRVVLTSYFYWYDVFSGAHLRNSDGTDALTDHPPTLTGFSYKSAAWHREQLLDMIDAGIDALLPVYWGEPSQRILGQPILAQPWSYSGLPPLVAAREELLAQGKQPPRIGLFYDTSTLQYNAAGRRIDLTTPEGRQWFYETIRDFFSLIPARHWAMIEGKPIIFLYSAAFAAAHDQTCIDFARQSFARDFGGREPYIVREISWNVRADNTYAWGGAISLRNPGVAALGPGYDHSAVPGREPLIVPRENGAFYERNWIRFLRDPSPLVHLETWNEYHEGTDIAASKEYGRQYLELTRKFVDMFKAGVKPPRPRGPFSDVKSVFVSLGETNETHGLTQIEAADGATRPAVAAGLPCRESVPTVHAGRYIYFQLHESYRWADRMLVDVEVEYFDAGAGSFRIEYDGSDPNAPFNGAYTASRTSVTLVNSELWKIAKFRLTEARFLNSQNSGADFRIALQTERLRVRRVTVTRLGVPAESGQVLRGRQQDFSEPLDPDWAMAGPADALTFTHGFLSLRPTGDRPARLVLRLPVGGADEGEVLARIRVSQTATAAGLLGGVAVGIDESAATALVCHLQSGGAGGRGVRFDGENLPPGPAAAFAWQPNTWYWLRVRHELRSPSSFPEVRARLWLADGETAEPDTWLVWWDYYPASTFRKGFVGISTGTVEPALECDYFLFKSALLPEITGRLPATKPARPALVPRGWSPVAGAKVDVQGSADTSYLVDTSPDLIVWQERIVATDGVGLYSYHDVAATNRSQRFYRGRVMP